jgi:hypothetical protein
MEQNVEFGRIAKKVASLDGRERCKDLMLPGETVGVLDGVCDG